VHYLFSGYLPSEYPTAFWILTCKKTNKICHITPADHEPELIAPVSTEDEFGKRDDVRIRHSAVYVRDEILYLFYTRKSDTPERIVMAEVPLVGDWKTWTAGAPNEVLRPEMDYEGINYPNEPSGKGGGTEVQQLRDPGIFEEDGQLYLLYSVAGEEGIAIAELEIENR
jgi:hypothetical protein